MNEDQKQLVSSLLDSEINENELNKLRKLMARNTSLKKEYLRYQMISSCFRRSSEPSVQLDTRLLVSIRNQIDQDTVVAFPRLKMLKSTRTWMKPVTGVAIAASVALVSVMGLRSMQTQPDESSPIQSGLLSQSVDSSIEQPIRYINPQMQRVVQYNPSRQWSQQKAQRMDPRLSALLVRHNEMTSNGGRGFIPYVKIVRRPVQNSINAIQADKAQPTLAE